MCCAHDIFGIIDISFGFIRCSEECVNQGSGVVEGWVWEMLDFVCGFIHILQRMLDHHGFRGLHRDIVEFTFGFITIVESWKELAGISRQP